MPPPGRSSSGTVASAPGSCWPGSRRRSWLGRISWSGWTACEPMPPASRSPRCRGCLRRQPPGWPGGSLPRSGKRRRPAWRSSPSGCWAWCNRCWRRPGGIAGADWADATGMEHAQVAVAAYCPDWGPAPTRLIIRRVRLDPAQVSADPRSRRRRTLPPDQRALPFPELARAGVIYGYSFILTNLDVTTPDKAAAVEHWYRHRTTVESIFRDSKLGAALRHLPSGYPRVNMAWMWGALLAACMAGWLHQLTARTAGQEILAGHGVRGGKAMIATLRWRLIAVPARLIRHGRQLILRLPPRLPPARRGPRPPP